MEVIDPKKKIECIKYEDQYKQMIIKSYNLGNNLDLYLNIASILIGSIVLFRVIKYARHPFAISLIAVELAFSSS